MDTLKNHGITDYVHYARKVWPILANGSSAGRGRV